MTVPSVRATPPSGAYGFSLIPTDPVLSLPDLIPLPNGAESVSLTVLRASSTVTQGSLGRDEILLAERRGSGLWMRREPAEVVMALPESMPGRALVHPTLAVPLSLLARWSGHVTLHAGAFEAGGAWGVLGDRTAGKSSMLAALSAGGVPIVADDLVVVDGDGFVLAGPRCVDLRSDVAERFAAAEPMGIVGGRPRFRLTTPPAPPRTPLRGFFVLEWGDGPEIELEPLGMRERLGLLYGQEYMGIMGAADPRRLVAIVGLPAWRLRRPRDWDAAGEVVERVLECASAQVGL